MTLLGALQVAIATALLRPFRRITTSSGVILSAADDKGVADFRAYQVPGRIDPLTL
jgi:hypothetical protein